MWGSYGYVLPREYAYSSNYDYCSRDDLLEKGPHNMYGYGQYWLSSGYPAHSAECWQVSSGILGPAGKGYVIDMRACPVVCLI